MRFTSIEWKNSTIPLLRGAPAVGNMFPPVIPIARLTVENTFFS